MVVRNPGRYKVEAHSLVSAEGGGAWHVALRVHIHRVSVFVFLYTQPFCIEVISGVLITFVRNVVRIILLNELCEISSQIIEHYII